MCGVAGIFNWGVQKEDSVHIVTQMLTMIKHRGPDESGIFADQKVCIGNVRLSIIDLSTGQQPMCDVEENMWIVFNGEIFNYIELREDLKAKGYTFKTSCDTEVLLHLYKHYGPSCLNYLNGQFVCAIWDRRKSELFVARDRVGIRPLFYSIQKDKFVFASEIKALIEHPSVQVSINPQVLSEIFTFWTPIPGKTVFNNIAELEPGNYMVIKENQLIKKCFWNLQFAEKGEYITNDFKKATEEFETILLDSVKLRLRSDVPVAAYLSGGLDSSITTSFIKKVSPANLQTFSIGFSDKDFDETLYQKEVSEYFQTKHTSFMCTPEDIAEVFPKVVWYSELPIIRTAPAPMFLLSQKVREQNIKVVITGEGADEIMVGYDIFKEAQIRRFWAKYPESRLRPLLLQKLYPYIPQIQNMNSQKLKFVFGYKLEDTNNPFYAHLLRWNNGRIMTKYFSSDIQASINGYNPVKEFENILPLQFNKWDELSQAQWVESNLLMSNYLLSSQGDRMGMGNSIEGRYPFLDYRLIEYSAKLPPDFKMRGLTEKYLLKRMMKDKLPASIVKRNKQAYRAPIISAFFSKNSPEYVEDLLSESKIKEYSIFDPILVNNLKNKFKTTLYSESDTMAITAILSTQLIYSQFISNRYKPKEYNQLLSPRVITKI